MLFISSSNCSWLNALWSECSIFSPPVSHLWRSNIDNDWVLFFFLLLLLFFFWIFLILLMFLNTISLMSGTWFFMSQQTYHWVLHVHLHFFFPRFLHYFPNGMFGSYSSLWTDVIVCSHHLNFDLVIQLIAYPYVTIEWVQVEHTAHFKKILDSTISFSCANGTFQVMSCYNKVVQLCMFLRSAVPVTFSWSKTCKVSKFPYRS